MNGEADFEKVFQESLKEAVKNLLDVQYNKYNNKIASVMGLGLALTKNSIEYVIKVLSIYKLE